MSAEGGEQAVGEHVVLEAKNIYCWPGSAMGATVLFVKQGRIVLTEHKLLYSSPKVNLETDLASITRCEGTKKRALTVWVRGADGAEAAYTFGTKMGMTNKESWIEQINARCK